MSTINKPICTLGTEANTGKPGCGFDPKTLRGALLVDENFSIDQSQATALLATLQAAVLATGTDRIYPIFEFGEINDASTEVKVVEHGYGDKEFGEDGQYDWTFKLKNADVCLQKRLRSFNGNSSKKVLFWDKKWKLIGTLGTDGKIYGISMSGFHAAAFKIADGANPTIYTVRFLLPDVSELNDKPGFAQADFNIGQHVKGNLDVVLEELAVAAGKITVGIKTACDQTNLFDKYADDLADITLFTLTKEGVDVTITGVTANTALEGWDVAFTGTGEHVLGMGPAADLAEEGVGGGSLSGFEAANTITSDVPAPA